MSFDLSIIIPARNEMWLKDTVEDVLKHTSAQTEIIVVMDGAWSDPPLTQDERVTIVHMSEPIGQRAATNLGMRMSTAKWVIKLDAHCSVAPGFDATMIRDAEALGPEVCQVPMQFALHVFDWVCDNCGKRSYQGPTPTRCEDKLYLREGDVYSNQLKERPSCGGRQFTKHFIWAARGSRKSTMWRFDSQLHFQYWNRVKDTRSISETMSMLGACWMVNRDHWQYLGMLDESHGSWGQMGTEVSCAFWLSGGRVVCNKNTWYAHLFRTQGGDFSFPYANTTAEQAKEYSKNLWRNGLHFRQTRPLRWLVDKFWPLGGDKGIPGWTKEERDALDRGNRHEDVGERHVGVVLGSHDEDGRDGTEVGHPTRSSTTPARVRGDRTSGAVYYTDGRLKQSIRLSCYQQLKAALGHLPIAVVDRPLGKEPGPVTMFEQILMGLLELDTDVAFLCEHDVLYHPAHFDIYHLTFDGKVYYNVNTWKVDVDTGKAVTYVTKQTSGLVADRQLLIAHYTKRIEMCRNVGFSRRMGFEPGTHGRAERVDDLKSEVYHPLYPNIDLRHGSNLTATRWKKEQFRDQRNCRGWQESNAGDIPGWPQLPDLLKEMR